MGRGDDAERDAPLILSLSSSFILHFLSLPATPPPHTHDVARVRLQARRQKEDTRVGCRCGGDSLKPVRRRKTCSKQNETKKKNARGNLSPSCRLLCGLAVCRLLKAQILLMWHRRRRIWRSPRNSAENYPEIHRGSLNEFYPCSECAPLLEHFSSSAASLRSSKPREKGGEKEGCGWSGRPRGNRASHKARHGRQKALLSLATECVVRVCPRHISIRPCVWC